MKLINGIEVAIAQPIFINSYGQLFITVTTKGNEHEIILLQTKIRKQITLKQLEKCTAYQN